MSDEITLRRLNDLENRIKALAEQSAAVHVDVTSLRTDVTDAFRNLDMRVTTEIRETNSLIRDLKAWLVERDDTRQRLAKLEETVARLQSGAHS